jgi:hypothetical protein
MPTRFLKRGIDDLQSGDRKEIAMNTNRWFLMGCAAAFLGIAGCRSTEVMMVNDLGEDTMVTLQGPGQINPDPPSLRVANMEKGVFKVQTPPGELPANYEWQAGGRTGTIVVTSDTPKRQVLNLSTGVPVSRTTVDTKGRRAAPSVDVTVKP